MKKIKQWLMALIMVISVLSPTAISAQAQAISTDDMSLDIINGLKTMQSAYYNYSGNFYLDELEEEVGANFDGSLQFILTPAFEFGFELMMDIEATEEGQSGDAQLELQSYLVGDSLYYRVDDSTEETDGEWNQMSAQEALGSDPAQVNMIYQMLISMFEGMYRGIYLPSTVHNLLSERTTIEEAGSGYTIVIESFETEEEWVAFFEALEELAEDASTEVETQTGVVTTEESLDELDEIKEMAQILSENLAYTLTINVNEDYLVTSFNINAEATNNATMESDVEVESFVLDFTLEAVDYNFSTGIEMPAELEALMN